MCGRAGLRVRKSTGEPSCHPSAARPGPPKFVGGGWGENSSVIAHVYERSGHKMKNFCSMLNLFPPPPHPPLYMLQIPSNIVLRVDFGSVICWVGFSPQRREGTALGYGVEDCG